MVCLHCNTHEAIVDPIMGILPCQSCSSRHQAMPKISNAIELATPEIKEDRKIYQKDIYQRYRNGVPSKEYIATYGTKGFTKEELRKAQNVWNDASYYKKENISIT